MNVDTPAHRDDEIHPVSTGHALQPIPGDSSPNPYMERPRLVPPSPAEVGVEELTTAECWRLVEASRLGRLALDAFDGRPDVFPINFLVHNGHLFVRSAPGAKLRSIAKNPAVAFEVDGSDDIFHWSVVIRAQAERMDTDADIEASGVLDLVSWSPTEKHDFVRLTPVTVTGRRFPKRSIGSQVQQGAAATILDEQLAGRGPASATNGDSEQREAKPHPIPHFAPRKH